MLQYRKGKLTEERPSPILSFRNKTVFERKETKMAKSKKEKAPKVVKGYESEPQKKKVKLITEEYEYELPFNYPNVTVNRKYYAGGEFHGIEMNVINSPNGIKDYEPLPADSIVIEEPHPIIRVAVIGSACTPPGYVQIACEPIKGWRRSTELESVMPVRMRITGLWGMHLRVDQWFAHNEEVNGITPSLKPSLPYEKLSKEFKERYKQLAKGSVKTHYREFPITGMSCAIFEIPPSEKVTIMGGGEVPGWTDDNWPDDVHYSFRIIRTTVKLPDKQKKQKS